MKTLLVIGTIVVGYVFYRGCKAIGQDIDRGTTYLKNTYIDACKEASS